MTEKDRERKNTEKVMI